MTSDWLAVATAGSQTGALARTFDWSATSLGPAGTWPSSLRSAVGICFGTRFPVLVTWGPELTMIYNDGYLEMLGTGKHPAAWAAPAREVWDDVWTDVGPLFARVLTTGEPTWVVDQPLLMERSGFLEETAFTYSYSALRDETGDVRGVLDIAYETTAQVVDRRRLATVTDLSQRLQGQVDVRAVAKVALDRLGRADDVSAAALYLGTEGEAVLLGTTGAHSLAVDTDLVRDVARTRRAVDLDGGGVVAPLATTPQAPTPAVVVLHGNPRRPFDADQHSFLRLVARTISTAMSSTLRVARVVEEGRRIGDALQAAMLPAVPSGPHLQARYQPAEGRLTVGGDWYDVVDLGPGRRALLVGDCVGHGLAAAAVMGQLRSAGRALLLEDTTPAATIESLDRFAATLPGAECTTVFCGIVDAAAGVLTYSSAGHPPALLTGARGQRWLDEAVAPPLAVQLGTRPQADVHLADGDTLLLYTDGLVERRHEPLDVGLARLASAAADLPGGALDASTIDRLLAALVPDGARDDVAVLVHRIGG